MNLLCVHFWDCICNATIWWFFVNFLNYILLSMLFFFFGKCEKSSEICSNLQIKWFIRLQVHRFTENVCKSGAGHRRTVFNVDAFQLKTRKQKINRIKYMQWKEINIKSLNLQSNSWSGLYNLMYAPFIYYFP